MGIVAPEICWRDKLVAAANQRPITAGLLVFGISAILIGEIVFLIWGYSTPPKEYLTALIRVLSRI
tara:strand:+ start:3871 stop:4068 length:198 start_codon:yes stop_codon:yes gene_type:complete